MTTESVMGVAEVGDKSAETSTKIELRSEATKSKKTTTILRSNA